jgi:hypothetical protein
MCSKIWTFHYNTPIIFLPSLKSYRKKERKKQRKKNEGRKVRREEGNNANEKRIKHAILYCYKLTFR